MLTAESLSRFEAGQYRRVEVLSGDDAPRVVSHGRMLVPREVSISHVEGISCACLGHGSPVGADLENVEPRVPSFYRGNFAHHERTWVGRMAEATGIRVAWYFTFIWVLKECAVKAGLLGLAGVWNFPQVHVHVREDAGEFTAQYDQERLGDAWAALSATITHADRETPVQVTFSATPRIIAAALVPLGGT